MLELEHISVRFAAGHGVQAVEDVTLTLEDGGRLAIVGETGSGKSVLLLAVLQLLPGSALVSGSARLDGEDLFAAGQKRLREIRGGVISYVPQGGGASLNPLYSVGFQVGEPLMEHRGYSKKKAFLASIPLLKRFQLGREEQLAKGISPHLQRRHAPAGHGGHGHFRRGPDHFCRRAHQGAGPKAGGPGGGHPEPAGDRGASVRDPRPAVCGGSVPEGLRHVRGPAGGVWQRRSGAGPTPPPYTQAMVRAMPENGMHVQEGFAPETVSGSGCRFRARCPYAQAQCEAMPPLVAVNDRKVRCWRYAAGNETADQTLSESR